MRQKSNTPETPSERLVRDIRRATASKASLGNTDLGAALLDGAVLQGADLANANLQGSVLDNARLQGATLNDARMQGSHMDRISVYRTHAVDVTLTDYYLADIDTWSLSTTVTGGQQVLNPDCDKYLPGLSARLTDKLKTNVDIQLEVLRPDDRPRDDDDRTRKWWTTKQAQVLGETDVWNKAAEINAGLLCTPGLAPLGYDAAISRRVNAQTMGKRKLINEAVERLKANAHCPTAGKLEQSPIGQILREVD